MIEARHDGLIEPFLRWYVRRIVERNFHRVELVGSVSTSGKAVLLLANHVGWWDGFWAMRLNDERFHRRFHAMMLEEQLRKFRFLRYLGAFSVRKNSRSMLESLRYAAQLLHRSENMVLIFPQGEIGSQQQGSVRFEKGVLRVLEQTDPDRVEIVFMVGLTDYFDRRKPVLTLYHECYEGPRATEDMQRNFEAFYRRCRLLQSQKTA